MIANNFLDTTGIDTLYKAVRAHERRERWKWKLQWWRVGNITNIRCHGSRAPSCTPSSVR